MNDGFELPNGSYSVSDILDYMELFIKKHETLTAIPPIHIYINRTNDRLVFKKGTKSWSSWSSFSQV